jgi:hypothetical protein
MCHVALQFRHIGVDAGQTCGWTLFVRCALWRLTLKCAYITVLRRYVRATADTGM